METNTAIENTKPSDEGNESKKKKKKTTKSDENSLEDGNASDKKSKKSKKSKKTKKDKAPLNTTEISTDEISSSTTQISRDSSVETTTTNGQQNHNVVHKVESSSSVEDKSNEEDDELWSSRSSLQMKVKDETELEKKQWQEMKKIQKEDSDEKMEDSDDDKKQESPTTIAPVESDSPTLGSTAMVEIMQSEVNASSGEDEESEETGTEQENSNDETGERRKLTRRPSLLAEPEFNENFLLDVLLTIRTCTLGSMKKSYEDISERDFETTIQYKISRTGPQKRFMLKDFSPRAFRSLRHIFHVSTEEYLQSWSKTNLKQEKSIGRSSSMFVFSEDKRFILKTISKTESKSLRDLMPSYYQHMSNYPNSFLMKFFGHHRMDYKGKKVYFVIMANVLHSTKKIHEIYDLKGSTAGRETVITDKQNTETVSVLKDNDFISSGRKLHLSPAVKAALCKQLEDDCKLLGTHEIMDYSLLLGIHRLNEHTTTNSARIDKMPKELRSSSRTILKRVPSLVFFCEDSQEISPRPKTTSFLGKTMRKKSFSFSSDSQSISQNSLQKIAGGLPSFGADGALKEYYYIGIIDILQRYNNKKRIAHIAKSIRYNKDTLSTVHPTFYSTRFKEFISKAIDTPDIFNVSVERANLNNTISDNDEAEDKNTERKSLPVENLPQKTEVTDPKEPQSEEKAAV